MNKFFFLIRNTLVNSWWKMKYQSLLSWLRLSVLGVQVQKISQNKLLHGWLTPLGTNELALYSPKVLHTKSREEKPVYLPPWRTVVSIYLHLHFTPVMSRHRIYNKYLVLERAIVRTVSDIACRYKNRLFKVIRF